MPKTPELGAVFSIDLEDGRHTYARIASSTDVAVYDGATTHSLPIEEIKKLPILFIVFCFTQFAEQEWERVGLEPLEDGEIEIPKKFSQDQKDPSRIKIVDRYGNRKRATYAEVEGLEWSGMWHPEQITQRVRDHYAGRANEIVERYQLKNPHETN